MFKHYLYFKSLGKEELYQICEPINFDSAQYVKEQESKRHARDVEYLAIDKLKFVIDVIGKEKADVMQLNSPQGYYTDILDLGFHWIVETMVKFGVNSEVFYKLSKDGVFFPTEFQLDFTEKNITDFETYVECKLIQNDRVAEIKRKYDDKVNLFSNEDYKGNTITPAQTINVLRKGLIQKKSSRVVLDVAKTINIKVENLLGTETREGWYNPAIKIVEADLKYTTTHLENYEIANVEFENYINPSMNVEDLYYYVAEKETYDLQIEIKNLVWRQKCLFAENGYVDFRFTISAGYSAASNDFFYLDVIQNTLDQNGQEITSTINQTFTIPYIPIGGKVFIYFYGKSRKSNIGSGQTWQQNFISPYEINLTANVKSLDIVIPTIRYIDYIKETVKRVNDINVVANDFSENGIFYNQVVWNKRMITGKKDQFLTSPKEALESVFEVNADFEMTNEKIEILKGNDFYTASEIAVFNIVPSSDINCGFNEKASLKKIKYEYKNYSDDREQTNSTQIIHAISEWNVPNIGGSSDFERSFDQIRDVVFEQDAIDLETKKPTSLTNRDDKFFLRDIIDLPPGTQNKIGVKLLTQGFGTSRKILNYSISLNDNENLGINWNNWGFVIGQTVNVNGENWIFNNIEEDENGVGAIANFTSPSSQNFQEDKILAVTYYYLNVAYVFRTNEGFTTIDGVSDNFGNLAYSPRRNLKNFEKYFAMSLINNDSIKNVEYKNNGNLITKIQTETLELQENQSFIKSEIENPYTNNLVWNVTCAGNYLEVVNFLENYKTDRGYVRFVNSNNNIKKGYIKDFSYTLTTNECEISFEEKYTENRVGISKENGIRTIDGIVMQWWEIINNKFKGYDVNSIPLTNYIDFNLVFLNGVNYTDKNLLENALEND